MINVSETPTAWCFYGISKVLVSQIKRGMKWRNVARFAGVDPNVMIAYRHNAHRRL